jgi:hypothetical protein
MVAAALFVLQLAAPVMARDANKTLYPIVFAHGMAGFNNILGYDYWGDDYGVFVLDPCDELLEVTCNGDINSGQKSFVASVTPFHNSEQRGLQLYNAVLNYMTTSGASYVNMVGHSQGGIDLRKAARLLYNNKGRNVVRYGISVSSPHRGSPIAKYVYQLKPGVTSVLSALANFYGNVVYASGNNAIEALKQLIYDDIDPNDGKTTGMKKFNTDWPVNSSYIARARSFLTGQNGLDMNPALYLVQQGWMNIDGDGYATTDANGDGALGKGDGYLNDDDDDGLVGVNSQQMGNRLQHSECFACLDYVYEKTDTGFCGSLNAPTSTMMTSHNWKIPQDHVDVIGVPPDTFDEMEFYAALTDYIADNGY